mmetsp:Transcript_5008/g.7495  ORF Transcript_5008/g.7495 Transcript_5008/m.7495 type:complete len:157 (-) Transcript_5008:1020-1490(-)
MVKPFNSLNLDVTCLGNHELDLGLPKAKELISQTNCPWIISNLFEVANNNLPVCNLPDHYIMEKDGLKIGFVGFAEREWIDQFSADVDPNQVFYEDYNETLRRLSKKLKTEDKCDIIIALNHMRLPEDKDMAEKNTTDVVDMIFGGHDHCYHSDLN